jgi:Tat protein translocase TatB subunit
MFGSIGGTELLLILVIALLVFGPRKLPDLGRTVGKAMAEFRRASNDFKSTLEREIRTDGSDIAAETKGLAKEIREAADLSAPTDPKPEPSPTPNRNKPPVG